MTLTTHAVAGATIMALMPNQPALGLALAFLSHFALDAIPHWDYPLRSMAEDEDEPLQNDMKFGWDFMIDLLKIGADFLLGLILGLMAGWWASGAWSAIILLGAFLAMLPDGLQFIYFKLRVWPLTWLQRFHLAIHTKHKLKGRPLLGVSSQLLFIIIILSIFHFCF